MNFIGGNKQVTREFIYYKGGSELLMKIMQTKTVIRLQFYAKDSEKLIRRLTDVFRSIDTISSF